MKIPLAMCQRDFFGYLEFLSGLEAHDDQMVIKLVIAMK